MTWFQKVSNTPYFIDSNVVIGYIFYNGDGQGKFAKPVMDSLEDKHSGTFVQKECFGTNQNGRCSTVGKQIAKEFRKVIAALKRGKMVSDILAYMAAKHCRTYSIVNDIIKMYGHDTSLLINMLDTSKNDFETGCVLRQDEIYKIVKFHDRNLPYRDIYDVLRKHICDIDDIEVILDAHHTARDIKELILVSGDYNHVTPFKNVICDNTLLIDVKPLYSFRVT